MGGKKTLPNFCRRLVFCHQLWEHGEPSYNSQTLPEEVSLCTSLQVQLTGPFCELVWIGTWAQNQMGRGWAESSLLGRFVEQDQQRLWLTSQPIKGRGQKEQGYPLGAELQSPVCQAAFSRYFFINLAKTPIVLPLSNSIQTFFPFFHKPLSPEKQDAAALREELAHPDLDQLELALESILPQIRSSTLRQNWNYENWY